MLGVKLSEAQSYLIKSSEYVRKYLPDAFRLTGEAKIEGIKEYLDTLISQNCKFLLFCHHKSVMDAYELHI